MKKILIAVFPMLLIFTIMRLCLSKDNEYLGFRTLMVNAELYLSNSSFITTLKDSVSAVKNFQWYFNDVISFFKVLGNFFSTIFVGLWNIVVSIFETLGNILQFIVRLVYVS